MPGFEKRLLAKTLDLVAEQDPDRLFAVVPQGPELTDGFRNLSIKDLARAVNFMCWWIEDALGPSRSSETLAYMGSNDVRYCIFHLACQKTGYQAFLPSTRNSDEAFLHLLKETACNKFFFSEEKNARVLEIQALNPSLKTFEVPTVKAMMNDEAGLRIYPYHKDYFEVENQTSCIIHSSGTTGMPKPVYLTNGFFMTMDAIPRLYCPEGRVPALRFSAKDRALFITPFFHLMGFGAFTFSIFHGVPVIIGPDRPLSVKHMISLIRATCPTAGVFPPSILEDMSHSDEALECLRGLDSVCFAGAPLARETGDCLRKYTTIISIIGSSETGYIPAFVPEDENDWGYFEWNPVYGVDMQDTGDGLYEMVIRRLPDGRDFQGIFHTFPDRDVYRTKDLYTRHPTNPNLWKFDGRQDDVIVLSNGEKFNPVTMELIIQSHPLVSRALVVGQSRFQAALLVEPDPELPEIDLKVFIEEIWPTVQAANQTIAAHGRVMKSKIGFASKAKPFKTTPKGTTQRRAVLQDYAQEINAIYEAKTEENLGNGLPETVNPGSVTEYTHQTISEVLGISDIPINQDLYSAGVDSLMTMQLARVFQRDICTRNPEVKPNTITPQTIYANPTVEQLARVLYSILKGESEAGTPRAEKIQKLVARYTADLPAYQKVYPQSLPKSPSIIILTGSTGSLGSYLLYDLLKTPSVSKIYCMNRSDAEIRQKKSFNEKGLNVDAEEWANKVEFLHASFGEPQLGLKEDKYEDLLDSVDTIVHNAWKVDFNHSVDSFEEIHIRGVRHFVDFSLKSRCRAHIHFVSSISAVGAWTSEMGPLVPEMPFEDSSVVLEQGYGESKHVAERICFEASRTSQVPTTIYRVGQVAGPTRSSGQWNRQEWLPTLVATSIAIRKIPNKLGSMEVDWIPVDTLSSIMLEMVHTRHKDQSEVPSDVFHLTNPQKASWSSLIPAIQEQYQVEPVDLSAWVAELESIQDPTDADVVEKPALKLLGFYQGLADESHATSSVDLDVQRAKEASAMMRSLQPISPPLMLNWLRQWQF